MKEIKYYDGTKLLSMKDINDLASLISTLGFPIGMCLIMCYYINKINDAHKEETDKFAEALNNNTVVLQKLCDKLDSEVNVNDKQ